MDDFTKSKNGKNWVKLLRQQQVKLDGLLEDTSSLAVAEFLLVQPFYNLIEAFKGISPRPQGQVFSVFDRGDLQMKIYGTINKNIFSTVLTHMYSSQCVDFYQKMNVPEKKRLLPYLSKSARESILRLNDYLPDTAGGIMDTEFTTITSNITAEEVMAQIRADPISNKMIFYLYVIDDDKHVLGVISLKYLILASPHDTVAKILHDDINDLIYAAVDEDKELVAHKIEKYDLLAIPVLNDSKQIVGIVSYDNAMDVLRDEETEDLEKFMGITSDDDDPSHYLRLSSMQHLKNRIKWVVGLFIAGYGSSLIMHKNIKILAEIPILALYTGMINDTGGNVGSQAAAVVIRAMSLGQITLGDWLKIIVKEAKVAFMFASCLFFLTLTKVILVSGEAVSEQSLLLTAFAISLAISLQVIASTILGALLPLCAKYFKGDPAIAASPAITTLVDITGTTIYFAVVMLLLR